MCTSEYLIQKEGQHQILKCVFVIAISFDNVLLNIYFVRVLCQVLICCKGERCTFYIKKAQFTDTKYEQIIKFHMAVT